MLTEPTIEKLRQLRLEAMAASYLAQQQTPDRGELSFKVVVQTQISFPPDGAAFTGIVDYMTDIGQAPGSLVSHPIVIGILNPTPSPLFGRSWSPGVGQ